MHIIQNSSPYHCTYLQMGDVGEIKWIENKDEATTFDEEDAKELAHLISSYSNVELNVIQLPYYNLVCGKAYLKTYQTVKEKLVHVTLTNQNKDAWVFDRTTGLKVVVKLAKDGFDFIIKEVVNNGN